MKCERLLDLFEEGRKRYHIVGDDVAGVVAGLDLEGRLYAVLDRQVLNRVNPDALLGTSTRDAYLNPGGDGLWPAPEGSCLGYEYATGSWRVPPGLSGARYWLREAGPGAASIRAEVDLINSRGLGVPVAFERQIRVRHADEALRVSVTECIEYLGARPLARAECLLAPWSLAQFDSGPGCEVVFPAVPAAEVWDLYEPSDAQRGIAGELWRTRTDASQRYQIGLSPQVPWLEYRAPDRSLRVRRTADALPEGLTYIDITDRAPAAAPADRGIRFSVYSDTTGFMEIEAAGGCPAEIRPGQVLAVTIHTTYGWDRR